MYMVLLVIHVIITLALIGIILIQRSSSDGLGGMGGGGMGGVMTSRGQANLLTRTTAILATLFIMNSLALSWLTQQDAPSRSIADKIVEQDAVLEVPSPEKEASVPAVESIQKPSEDEAKAAKATAKLPASSQNDAKQKAAEKPQEKQKKDITVPQPE